MEAFAEALDAFTDGVQNIEYRLEALRECCIASVPDIALMNAADPSELGHREQ